MSQPEGEHKIMNQSDKELCAICNPDLQGSRNLATTRCLRCQRPICNWHGYPRYEGEIKTEHFVGRICYLCLRELAITPEKGQHS